MPLADRARPADLRHETKSTNPKFARLATVFVASLIATAATAQSDADLLKLHDSLNDMCRDGAGGKTGQACETRELVGQMLKAKNICFGELGRVLPCRPATGTNEAGQGMPSAPQREACQWFAENEIIQVRGFLVEFDYAAEEVTPTKVEAVVLDSSICFDEDPRTKLRVLMLSVKHAPRLGRHYSIKMRMESGESWSGAVQAITEDNEIPQ